MIDRKILYIALPAICLTFFLLINRNGCQAYIWTLFLFLVCNSFLIKEYRFINFVSFHIFLSLAMAVYLTNLYEFPHCYGLTSGEAGTGTDDGFFYNSVADWCPPDFAIERANFDGYFYCSILKFCYPFFINDPIKIIILNLLLGIVFLPYYTAMVAKDITGSDDVAKKAYKLILFCPFCWAGGLLIMRDIVAATLLMISFHLYYNKKYIYFVLFVYLLFLVKFGFLVFLFVPIYVKYLVESGSKWGLVLLSTIGLVLLIFSYISAHLYELTGGVMESGEIFRSGFVEFLLQGDKDSFLAKIYELPVIIRIPLLILAFMTIPMLRLSFGYSEGLGIIPHSLFYSTAYPLYIVFVSQGFWRLIASVNRPNKTSRFLIWTLLLMALGLGLVSLQLRHKAVMMPFIYIAIAYGLYRYPRSTNSNILQCGYALANIVYGLFL